MNKKKIKKVNLFKDVEERFPDWATLKPGEYSNNKEEIRFGSEVDEVLFLKLLKTDNDTYQLELYTGDDQILFYAPAETITR